MRARAPAQRAAARLTSCPPQILFLRRLRAHLASVFPPPPLLPACTSTLVPLRHAPVAMQLKAVLALLAAAGAALAQQPFSMNTPTNSIIAVRPCTSPSPATSVRCAVLLTSPRSSVCPFSSNGKAAPAPTPSWSTRTQATLAPSLTPSPTSAATPTRTPPRLPRSASSSSFS